MRRSSISRLPIVFPQGALSFHLRDNDFGDNLIRRDEVVRHWNGSFSRRALEGEWPRGKPRLEIQCDSGNREFGFRATSETKCHRKWDHIRCETGTL